MNLLSAYVSLSDQLSEWVDGRFCAYVSIHFIFIYLFITTSQINNTILQD